MAVLQTRRRWLRMTVWERLGRTHLPVMATTRLSLLIDHWVVIKKWSGDSVTLIDPLRGEVVTARSTFEKNWRHVLVTLSCPDQQGHRGQIHRSSFH